MVRYIVCLCYCLCPSASRASSALHRVALGGNSLGQCFGTASSERDAIAGKLLLTLLGWVTPTQPNSPDE